MQSYKKYFIPTREIRNICKSGILGYPKTSPAPQKVPQKPPKPLPICFLYLLEGYQEFHRHFSRFLVFKRLPAFLAET